MSHQPEKTNSPSFADFLNLWKSNSTEESDVDYKKLIQSNPLIENLLSLGPCFVYMLDYQKMKYIYLSSSFKSITGYDVSEAQELGTQFFFSKIHPDDIKELMENTFKKIIEYYNSTLIEERKKIRCAYDYRVKRSDNKYIRFLQQTLVVEIDKDGNPLIDIGIVSDITDYKKSNQINLTLSKYDQEFGFVSANVSAEQEVKPDRISERELEILKLLMKGYSSKKIADELNISINTVRNHRQNLLEKTKTKNIAELIAFALSRSLI